MNFIKSMFTVLVLCTVSLTAQNLNQEEDHNALRKMKAAFEEAVNSNQLEKIRPFMDSSFSIVTFTDREFTDFDAFTTQWAKTRNAILKGGTYSIKLIPVRSQIEGSIAIARGDSENKIITGSGKEFSFTSHWTVICKKQNGTWKIVRGHNSLDPFGNPMLKDGVSKIVITVGVIALCIGAILGALIMVLYRFRSAKRVSP